MSCANSVALTVARAAEPWLFTLGRAGVGCLVAEELQGALDGSGHPAGVAEARKQGGLRTSQKGFDQVLGHRRARVVDGPHHVPPEGGGL